jgi:DNA-binding response OmpR family regulator
MGEANPSQRLLLVVDDMAENRALLSRYFGSRGFRIAQADCGATALGLIKRQRFDAVLLDIVMPEIDGIEVLKRIREIHAQRELPVIMVSAKSASMDISLALDLGANDYITKPIDLADALARVQRHLAPARAEPAMPQSSEAAVDAKAADLPERAARLMALATKFRREGHSAYADQLAAKAAQYRQ